MKKLLYIVSGTLILIAIALIFAPWKQQSTLQGPPTGGDFELKSASGKFSSKAHRGEVFLIYFGYTFCPDICPTNLAIMAQAYHAMSPAEQEQVQGIFISVDPERDMLEHLSNYAGYFHPDFIGLTADTDRVKKLADKYGAAYRKAEGASAGGYLIDHSSYTYLVNKEGKLAHAFNHATPAQQILAETRKWLTADPPTTAKETP